MEIIAVVSLLGRDGRVFVTNIERDDIGKYFENERNKVSRIFFIIRVQALKIIPTVYSLFLFQEQEDETPFPIPKLFLKRSFWEHVLNSKDKDSSKKKGLNEEGLVINSLAPQPSKGCIRMKESPP